MIQYNSNRDSERSYCEDLVYSVKSEHKTSRVVVTNISVETVAESASSAVINQNSLSDIVQAVRKYVFEADNAREIQPSDRQFSTTYLELY